MRKAVFLDKDGIINELIERSDGRFTSPWTLEEFKSTINPYIFDHVKTLKELNYMVFVVTNQPGVLDGEMYMTELDDICGYLEEEVGVNHVLYALKKDSDLYKPNNGMIEALIRTYKIYRHNSFMIGDRWKDIVAGNKSDLITMYVNKEKYDTPELTDVGPNHSFRTLDSAIEMIKVYTKERRL